MFIPNLTALQITSSNHDQIYVLGYKSSQTEGGVGVGMYHLADGSYLQGGTAYIKLTETQATSAKIVFAEEDETPTGITTVNTAAPVTGNLYDITGRRVSRPVKGGVYIRDGRKILY